MGIQSISQIPLHHILRGLRPDISVVLDLFVKEMKFELVGMTVSSMGLLPLAFVS